MIIQACIDHAKAKVEAVMREHEHAVIAFSGGKDSLAVLRLFYPYRARVTVASVDTGAMWPHMVDFVKEQCADYQLEIVRSDQASYWQQYGIPSRIVPVFNHPVMGFRQHAHGKRTLINDWTSCHHQLIDLPFADFVAKSGATLCVIGQRDDEGYMTQPSHVAGAVLFQPISAWTQQVVYAYLAMEGVTPPPQYPGVQTSLDCWNCPAHTTAETIQFMKSRNPELLSELQRVMRATYDTVGAAIASELPAIEAAGAFQGAAA